MKTISALTVRQKFGSILDEVAKHKEPVTITRANRPLVVIEPYETYVARKEQTTRRVRLLEVSRRIDEWARRNAKHSKGTTDVVTLLRKGRDTR